MFAQTSLVFLPSSAGVAGYWPLYSQMNQELTYSEKLLRYMRRCCCCWMCDSCTGGLLGIVDTRAAEAPWLMQVAVKTSLQSTSLQLHSQEQPQFSLL
jgi:hypothetical protein